MNGYIFKNMKISVKKIVLIAAVMLSCRGMLLRAQTEKDITVSYDAPYTDHVALGRDSRDTDIMVKFRYDQAANTLTVSAISYRKLFVFRDRTRYGSIVNMCGRIIPEKFPYVIDSDPDSKYKFSKSLKRSIKGGRRKHVFSGWMECTGLQMQPSEYHMENDYVEQTFDILRNGTPQSITLREIFFLEDGKITLGKDLRLRYNITLRKNPCMGKDEEIAEAATTLQNLLQNYNTLKITSNGGVASTQESADLFASLKEAVLSQFPRRDTDTPSSSSSSCPVLKETWEKYNACVDSLSALQCVFTPKTTGVDIRVIQMNTRELDDNVSRWLFSKDPVEKRDLAAQNEEIIKDMENLVQLSGLADEEQRSAYELFKKAARYSRMTIK